MRRPRREGKAPGPPPLSIAKGGPRPPDYNGVAQRPGSSNATTSKKSATNDKTMQVNWAVSRLSRERRTETILKFRDKFRENLSRFSIQPMELRREPVPLGVFGGEGKATPELLESLNNLFERRKRRAQITRSGPSRKKQRESCLGPQLCQKWTIILTSLQKCAGSKEYGVLKRRLLGCGLTKEEIGMMLEAVPSDSLVASKKRQDWQVATARVVDFVASHGHDALYPDERFIRLLASVPNLRFRLEAMAVRANFDDRLSEISKEVNLLQSAIALLRGHERLRELLGILLSCGNAMNEGTNLGDQRWFKMSNLNKFSETYVTDPVVARSQGRKRSLTSVVAQNFGPVLSDEERGILRRSLCAKLRSPFQAYGKLQDVFQLLNSLQSESDQNKGLRLKRRKSVVDRLLDLEDIDMSREDDEDIFVDIFRKFVRDGKPQVEALGQDLAGLHALYIDLVVYLGCPEEFLPLDKVEEGGLTPSYIPDVIHVVGQWILDFDKESEMESKILRNRNNSDRSELNRKLLLVKQQKENKPPLKISEREDIGQAEIRSTTNLLRMAPKLGLKSPNLGLAQELSHVTKRKSAAIALVSGPSSDSGQPQLGTSFAFAPRLLGPPRKRPRMARPDPMDDEDPAADYFSTVFQPLSTTPKYRLSYTEDEKTRHRRSLEAEATKQSPDEASGYSAAAIRLLGMGKR